MLHQGSKATCQHQAVSLRGEGIPVNSEKGFCSPFKQLTTITRMEFHVGVQTSEDRHICPGKH